MSVPAFRYFGGALVSCPNYGATMRLAIPSEAAPRLRLRPLPERARSVGLYGFDLALEAKRSGVPAWFKPNASRRGRYRAWSAMTREQRRRAEPLLPCALVDFAHFDGHHMGAQIAATNPWEAPLDFSALLYLPEGEKPTAQHGRDLWRAMSLR